MAVNFQGQPEVCSESLSQKNQKEKKVLCGKSLDK